VVPLVCAGFFEGHVFGLAEKGIILICEIEFAIVTKM
jgi:hypothetical protein